MDLDYYEGAVGGDRSWTLIDAGRHTTIAENYGNGINHDGGAWDFIDSMLRLLAIIPSSMNWMKTQQSSLILW